MSKDGVWRRDSPTQRIPKSMNHVAAVDKTGQAVVDGGEYGRGQITEIAVVHQWSRSLRRLSGEDRRREIAHEHGRRCS
jgi:hypothetical protein